MSELSLLPKVRMALRLSTTYYDTELADLVMAAKMDLGIAGVIIPCEMDALCQRAIITYCKLHFGDLPKDSIDRLKASYDEQKAQLMSATGYTNWGLT